MERRNLSLGILAWKLPDFFGDVLKSDYVVNIRKNANSHPEIERTDEVEQQFRSVFPHDYELYQFLKRKLDHQRKEFEEIYNKR